MMSENIPDLEEDAMEETINRRAVINEQVDLLRERNRLLSANPAANRGESTEKINHEAEIRENAMAIRDLIQDF